MAFCINCGHELIEGAKFCANCGISTNNIEVNTKRKMVYDGEIHKCPNCGEILKSFQGNCSSCGYELRGIKSSSSVKELTIKLEQIEKNRKEKKRFSFKNSLKFEIDEIDEQKISLIRSFTIPNTKEDLYEFLFLSYSNIDFDSYDDGNQAMLFSRRAISDAWKASFEQAYQKSKIIFANDTDKLREIQQLYDSSKKSIKKAKFQGWKTVGIIWGVLIGVSALIAIIIGIYSPISEKKEIERLEAIVTEIEIQLEKGEYKYALMNADSLVYSGSISNDEQERQWVVKREYWIDKVLDEASKNGIKLERPQDSIISEPETSTESVSGGFFEGFAEGLQSGLDEAENSIEEFNSIMNQE